ncbi:hypothetical protein ACF07D_13910 [Leucobacter sp. NPDC015123]|uniref:hypothetical protein n=1 Tax=Leucobacter sp. NPDC015123 TaxID=3364129 RepID=UPI0036F45C1F
MIAKLLSQEFITTRKTLLTTVGILLIVILMGYAIAILRVPVLDGLGLGAGIAGTIALTPVVLAVLVASYWRTMYGAQGYFTMTLPVRGRTIFAAKVLYGILVSFVAAALTAALLALAAVALAVSKGVAPADFIRELLTTVDPGLAWFVVVALLMQLVFAVIAGAALMSIGAEGRFNHLGFAAPVIFTVVLYFVMQLLGLAAMLFIPFGIRIGGPDAGTFVAQGMFQDFLAALKPGDPAGADPSVLGLGVLFVSLVLGVVLAWWGARSVDRRTSLR